MGDILKNNPILSHFLLPLLLIFMVLWLFAKPYVDAQDDRIEKSVESQINVKMDTVIDICNETLKAVQK